MLWLVETYMDCETDPESLGGYNTIFNLRRTLKKKKKQNKDANSTHLDIWKISSSFYFWPLSKILHDLNKYLLNKVTYHSHYDCFPPAIGDEMQ